MRKRLAFAAPLTLALTLIGCGWIDPKPPHFVATKVQPGPFEGQVSAMHTDTNAVSTESKRSDGSTDFLTIKVKPVTDLTKLHKGDRIAGRIVVEPNDVYLTDVKINR